MSIASRLATDRELVIVLPEYFSGGIFFLSVLWSPREENSIFVQHYLFLAQQTDQKAS